MIRCYLGVFLMWLGRTSQKPGYKIIRLGQKLHVGSDKHVLQYCKPE